VRRFWNPAGRRPPECSPEEVLVARLAHDHESVQRCVARERLGAAVRAQVAQPGRRRPPERAGESLRVLGVADDDRTVQREAERRRVAAAEVAERLAAAASVQRTLNVTTTDPSAETSATSVSGSRSIPARQRKPKYTVPSSRRRRAEESRSRRLPRTRTGIWDRLFLRPARSSRTHNLLSARSRIPHQNRRTTREPREEVARSTPTTRRGPPHDRRSPRRSPTTARPRSTPAYASSFGRLSCAAPTGVLAAAW
jgi:hypothetical protein